MAIKGIRKREAQNFFDLLSGTGANDVDSEEKEPYWEHLVGILEKGARDGTDPEELVEIIKRDMKQKYVDPDSVDAEEVDRAFAELHDERHAYRLEEFRQLFVGRENDGVPLWEIESLFLHTRDPRNSAQRLISRLNSELESYGIELERDSIYRFRRKTIKNEENP